MTGTHWLGVLFWLGVGGVAYAYLGFPLLVSALARWSRVPPPLERERGTPVHTVTVVIPAYNEEAALENKIRNVLGTDYPRQLLDVIVISDASTDRTNEIARGFAGEGIRLIVNETRQGKTAGLNRAVEAARGTIMVLTDANAAYPPVTIGALAGYFDNPRVGLVSGYTRYSLIDTGEVTEATNLYTALERIIKRAESRWGCCVGADGAIFAMRRSLYTSLRADDINDFVLPLTVIDQGYDCVFAEDAFCSEQPGKNMESEFRRQSRITNRTLRALWRNVHLLNPLRFPGFAFLLFSHKVVRFMVPLFLVMSALTLVALAASGGMYLLAALAAVAGVTVTFVSNARSRLGRLFHFLNVFLTINAAVLNGWWKFLTGQGDVTWQHDRSVA